MLARLNPFKTTTDDSEVSDGCVNIYHSGNMSYILQDYNPYVHHFFASQIHPNIAVPWKIEVYRGGQRMLIQYNRFDPIEVDKLSEADKDDIATQLELVLLFLELVHLQITAMDPQQISYTNGHVLVHGFTGLQPAKYPSFREVRTKISTWLGKCKIKLTNDMIRAIHPLIVADEKVLAYLKGFDLPDKA